MEAWMESWDVRVRLRLPDCTSESDSESEDSYAFIHSGKTSTSAFAFPFLARTDRLFFTVAVELESRGGEEKKGR